jgi:hypothetical protein
VTKIDGRYIARHFRGPEVKSRDFKNDLKYGDLTRSSQYMVGHLDEYVKK